MSNAEDDYCCFLSCQDKPDWVVIDNGDNRPDSGITYSCTAHLGEMIGVAPGSNSEGKEYPVFSIHGIRPWVWGTVPCT